MIQHPNCAQQAVFCSRGELTENSCGVINNSGSVERSSDSTPVAPNSPSIFCEENIGSLEEQGLNEGLEAVGES